MGGHGDVFGALKFIRRAARLAGGAYTEPWNAPPSTGGIPSTI